jgi:hypothetical protein
MIALMHLRDLALAAALGTALLATPAAAQQAGPVVVVQPAGFAETAVASCAGGAMIGYLAVIATGAPAPFGTAALFCGLSVAATMASSVAVWTWHKATFFLY